MLFSLIAWAGRTFKPQGGWAPLFLLVAAVSCLLGAVMSVAWTNELSIIVPVALVGLWLGVVLAQRPLAAGIAWLFLTLYGIVFTFINLGGLWPPWSVFVWLGGAGVAPYWRQNVALLWDKMAGWWQAVGAGNSSQETIVFTGGLALLAWFLSAYVAWSTYRQRRPLLGLTVMGLALALNGYFGGATIEWAALFVGVAALMATVMHFTNLRHQWDQRQIDYSEEIGLELAGYAGGIATGLLVFALFLPGFRISELADFFRQQPVVQQAEQTLQRAFAGLDVQQDGGILGRAGLGGMGILPRSYLLGEAPEMYETVVMTATVQVESATSLPSILHWRALSYDVYTGRGWALSEERREAIGATEPIPWPQTDQQVIVQQAVHWLLDNRVVRYSIGLPVQLNQDTITLWRGVDDLVRVQSDGDNSYEVVSKLPLPVVPAITAAAEVPPVILARYTQLPDNLPARVGNLAKEIVEEADTPYEQAVALERFLRQYKYSLDVPPPPRNVDPVDYFLFESQTGYCDFYASSMVVLARSIGLPARLAIGYLAQPPDEKGVQIVRQINGHSWAEVYLAGYGWVEFEPTAPFYTPHEEQTPIAPADVAPSEPPEVTPLVPIPEPQTPFVWGRVWIVLLLASMVGWWQWRQRRPRDVSMVVWVYGRLLYQLQKLGQPVSLTVTPYELGHDLPRRLVMAARTPRVQKMVQRLTSPIVHLATLFMRYRYSANHPPADVEAEATWQQLKWPLWWLRFWRWLRQL